MPLKMQNPRRLPWLLLISAFIYAADQYTKLLVTQHIRLGGAIPVLDGIFRITHWTNAREAFSLFADPASPSAVRWGLVAFTVIASLAVLIALIRMGHHITTAT